MIRIFQITFFLSFFNLIFAQTEYIYVLGNVQDAGLPHIGCQHKFCKEKFSEFEEYFTTSIAVVDPVEKKYILFEASPDIPYQLNYLEKEIFNEFLLPESIFITHAHIGHYTGLLYFGREALGAKNLIIKVIVGLDINGNVINLQFHKNTLNEIARDKKLQPYLDSAIRAIKKASPFEGLKKDRYNNWKELIINFKPIEAR